MSHASECTGCPRCNSVFGALMEATPEEQAQFGAARTAADLKTMGGEPRLKILASEPVVGEQEYRRLLRRAGVEEERIEASVRAAADTDEADGPGDPPDLAQAIKRRRAGLPAIDRTREAEPTGPNTPPAPPDLQAAIRRKRGIAEDPEPEPPSARAGGGGPNTGEPDSGSPPDPPDLVERVREARGASS